MVEVFKTNVDDPGQASKLVELIHKTFTSYQANFDLQDCDRILRVRSSNGFVMSGLLIDMVNNSGFHAEVLPDDCPDIEHSMPMNSGNRN